MIPTEHETCPHCGAHHPDDWLLRLYFLADGLREHAELLNTTRLQRRQWMHPICGPTLDHAVMRAAAICQDDYWWEETGDTFYLYIAGHDGHGLRHVRIKRELVASFRCVGETLNG